MKIGFVGQAESDSDHLRRASNVLIDELGVDTAIYLGSSLTAAQLHLSDTEISVTDTAHRAQFFQEALQLILKGTSEQIHQFVESQHPQHSQQSDERPTALRALRMLPPAPFRTIEMLDDRIVLFVHDKSLLTEEDIINAHIVVYGHAEEPLLRQFGSRYFFTPGPLSKERIGVLEYTAPSCIRAMTFDLEGNPDLDQVLQGRRQRVSVF